MAGIRSLDVFFNEHRLLRSMSLETLKNATLGIDASYFVSKTMDMTNHREPLLPAIGGFPCGLESSLDSFISILRAHDIEAVFVFKGLHLAGEESTPNASSSVQARRQRAWDLYEKHKGDDAVVGFNESAFFDSYGDRLLIDLLIARNVRFLVAPFTASAQLALMCQSRSRFTVERKAAENGEESISVITAESETDEASVDAIYGSNDILIYGGVDRLITHIDQSASTAQWVTKSSILSELNISSSMFAELAVAVGCELNRITFPLIEGMHQQQLSNKQRTTYIKLAKDLIQAHGSIYSAILAFPDTDGSAPFLEKFEHGVSCAEYQPVLYASGQVWPYKSDYIPANIHEFVGQRLPDEILFYLSRGLIGPELLTALISGELVIDASLDGGASKEYRDFLLNNERTLWGFALNYLAQVLHRYYQFRPISVRLWFEDLATRHNFERIQTPLYIKIGTTWRVQQSLLTENKFAGDLGSVVLTLGSNSEFVLETAKPIPKDELVVFQTDDEILFNAYGRMLQTIGLFDSGHRLTEWGQVVFTALEKDRGNQFATEIILAVGLLRAGMLNSKTYSTGSTGTPVRGNELDRQHTLLMSRVATLLPLHHKPVGFHGPLSMSLLSFQAAVNSQIKAYRWLIEAVLVSLLANGDADRLARPKDEQWWSLAVRLPFASSASCANGIAMKTYLEELISHDRNIQHAKESLSKMLRMAVDPVKDVARTFIFWDCIKSAVNKANELKLIDDKLNKEFSDTDSWLKSCRY